MENLHLTSEAMLRVAAAVLVYAVPGSERARLAANVVRYMLPVTGGLPGIEAERAMLRLGDAIEHGE